MTESVIVSLKSADGKQGTVEGTRVCFSVYQCFAVMDEDSRTLVRRLADHLRQQPGLALWDGPLLEPLLDAAPDLRRKVQAVITSEEGPVEGNVAGIKTCSAESLPGRRRDGVRLRHTGGRAHDGGRCTAEHGQADRRRDPREYCV